MPAVKRFGFKYQTGWEFEREVQDNVNEGAKICSKLKEIYYPNDHWKHVYREIADKFTAIKQKTREFVEFGTENELLVYLNTFSDEALTDAYDLGQKAD